MGCYWLLNTVLMKNGINDQQPMYMANCLGAACLYGSSISSKDLISVSGVIPHEVVQALFAACKSGNFDLANKEVNNIIAEGYPISQMLSQLFDVIVEANDISDEQKARICKKLGEADKSNSIILFRLLHLTVKLLNEHGLVLVLRSLISLVTEIHMYEVLLEKVLKAHQRAEADILDRLSTPFGLVRSGVAPDHPETKLLKPNVFDFIEKHNLHDAINEKMEMGGCMTLKDYSSTWVCLTITLLITCPSHVNGSPSGCNNFICINNWSTVPFSWWHAAEMENEKLKLEHVQLLH
ncbi:hypothetical protein Ancab_036533 [Ancistrocladus abbreviatus]